MRREVLFRGKHIITKEWVYGYVVDNKCGNTFILRVFNNGLICYDEWEVDPETVGQFTGLTDKNGVKIFEGDLVEDFRCMKFNVIFKDSAFCLKRLNCDYYEIIAKYGSLRVIGNIHDKDGE